MMARFNIEVELDWMREDESLDETLQQKIVSGIQEKLTRDISTKMEKQLSEIITKRVSEIADTLLLDITTNSIGEIQIPIKTSDWNSKIEYVSLTEFIGIRFEKFMTEKRLTADGRAPDYRNDAKFTMAEYLLQGYLEKELLGKVTKVIEKSRTDAEKTVITTLEETLRAQLSADIISRLNVPELLQSLQSKAVMLEHSNKK